MTAATSISAAEMKAILLAALAEQGLSAQEADRLSETQVVKLWKRWGGTKRYFKKDHRGREVQAHRRKVIYMEWWTHRPTGPDLQKFLESFNITEERLRQIQAEGRRMKWAS